MSTRSLTEHVMQCQLAPRRRFRPRSLTRRVSPSMPSTLPSCARRASVLGVRNPAPGAANMPADTTVRHPLLYGISRPGHRNRHAHGRRRADVAPCSRARARRAATLQCAARVCSEWRRRAASGGAGDGVCGRGRVRERAASVHVRVRARQMVRCACVRLRPTRLTPRTAAARARRAAGASGRAGPMQCTQSRAAPRARACRTAEN